MSVENKTQIRHQLWFRVCDTWLKCLAHTHSFFAFKLLLFFGCFSSHCNIWTHIRARSVSRWSNEYRFSLSKAFCLWIMNVADLTKMDYFFSQWFIHTLEHIVYGCTRVHDGTHSSRGYSLISIWTQRCPNNNIHVHTNFRNVKREEEEEKNNSETCVFGA